MVTNAEVLASPVDYIQSVRALAPAFAAGQAHAETCSELDPHLVAEMHSAGLFRMLLPAWLNGGALDPLTYTNIVEEIARHDASAAWCVNQGSGCSMVVANLDEATARRIFGSPSDVLAWGPSPGAKAVAVDGGYRLNYSGSFASGSRHGTWLGALCQVYNADGTARLQSDGRNEMRAFMFPKARADVRKIWDVAGLRGTGSDSYVVTDLFVPAEFSVIRDDKNTRRDPSPHYRYSSSLIYASGFAHVGLGIARGFMEDFLDLAVHKMPRDARNSLRDTATVQAGIALCKAKWESARHYLRACIGEAWDTAIQSGFPTSAQRVAVRLASTHAIHSAKGVVDILYDAAGSHAILKSGPFERRFRDMHAVTQQLQGRKSHFENVGRFLLGHDVDPASLQI